MSGLIDIYVRDKQSGRIHRVGDTRRDGCGYEFVPNVDDYGFNYDPREVNNGRISE